MSLANQLWLAAKGRSATVLDTLTFQDPNTGGRKTPPDETENQGQEQYGSGGTQTQDAGGTWSRQTQEYYRNLDKLGGSWDEMTVAELNRYGTVLLGFAPMEKNFPFMHEDRAPFSPFTRQIDTPDNLLWLAIVAKGLTKDNYKAFTQFMDSYMTNCQKVIGHISDMGNQNWMSNVNATLLLSGILHRMGLLDDAGYVRSQEHCRTAFDKLYIQETALGALNGVSTLINGSKVSNEGGSSGLSNLALLAKGLI